MLTVSILFTLFVALLLNALRRRELMKGWVMECLIANVTLLEFTFRPHLAEQLFNDLRDLELRNAVTVQFRRAALLMHQPRSAVIFGNIMGTSLYFAGTYVVQLARATLLWAVLSFIIDNFFPWTFMLIPLVYISMVIMVIELASNLIRTRKLVQAYADDIQVLAERYSKV